jgi:hypothetical protein
VPTLRSVEGRVQSWPDWRTEDHATGRTEVGVELRVSGLAGTVVCWTSTAGGIGSDAMTNNGGPVIGLYCDKADLESLRLERLRTTLPWPDTTAESIVSRRALSVEPCDRPDRTHIRGPISRTSTSGVRRPLIVSAVAVNGSF